MNQSFSMSSCPDCDNFVTPVTSRLDRYQVDDIKALHLAQDERFEKNHSSNNQTILANLSSTFFLFYILLPPYSSTFFFLHHNEILLPLDS